MYKITCCFITLYLVRLIVKRFILGSSALYWYLNCEQHGEELSLVSDKHGIADERNSLFNCILNGHRGNIFTSGCDDQFWDTNINFIRCTRLNPTEICGNFIITNLMKSNCSVVSISVNKRKHKSVFDWGSLPLMRPVINRKSSSSCLPRSPECSQPSASRASSVLSGIFK